MAQYAARNMEVTIVIPVYNRAGCLLRTLESIPTSFPIIVVDNGSTDGSATMAEDYCRQRSGAVFATENEAGAPAARNRGLALCQTEWVYFFDSDDEFTSLPDVDGAMAAANDMICFPVQMVVDGKERTRDFRSTADAATHILCAMLGTHSMLFRTEWLRSIGGWDNRCRIWNDWELGLRALLHHPRLQWIDDEPRHRIKIHGDSITGPSYSARWQRIVGTLTIARDEIRAAATVSRASGSVCATVRRAERAFCLRCHIVSGHLLHEGHREGAAAVRALADASFWGRVLQCYTAHGGRGAWRIALALLNI